MSVRVKPVGLPRKAARIVSAVTSPKMKRAGVFAISTQLTRSRQVRNSDNGWPIEKSVKT
jgi:hypothetical protein